MKEEYIYVMQLIADGASYYLLWVTGGGQRDRFVTLADTDKPMAAGSEEEIRKVGVDLELTVDQSDPDLVDFDDVRSILKHLRRDRPISKSRAEKLLNAWNAVEDCLGKYGGRSAVLGEVEQHILDSIYDKIFWGNNLPSITPANHQYEPIFSPDELRILRLFLRRSISEIKKRLE